VVPPSTDPGRDMELLKNAKISSAITPTAGAAGTTAINGSVLDMANYEGVLIMVRMGAITATAVTSLKVQQGAASNMSDAADLVGTGITVADDDDEQLFAINVLRPRERYVRLVVSRGTANAVVSSAEYIQYGPRKGPINNNVTDLVTVEAHVSPAEGTA
jgi:hypothetical protein